MGFSLCRTADGVEGTRAISSKNHGPGMKILHSETKRVKGNGTIVVDGELSKRDKIFNNMRNNKNITKM